MPYANGHQGYSEYTPIKQSIFEGVLRIILTVVKKQFDSPPSWAQCDWFEYYDLYAGCGTCGGQDGSPVVFLKTIQEYGIPYWANLYEKDKDGADRLWRSVKQYGHAIVNHGDNRMTIRPELRVQKDTLPRFGLIYADPNGLLDWDILQWMSRMKRYSRTDILINIQAARGYKLHRARFPEKYSFLTEYIAGINKKGWLVREPYGKHQWTFLYGTNWVNKPEWKKADFYDITSPEGRDILYRLNFTNKEQRNHGPIQEKLLDL